MNVANAKDRNGSGQRSLQMFKFEYAFGQVVLSLAIKAIIWLTLYMLSGTDRSSGRIEEATEIPPRHQTAEYHKLTDREANRISEMRDLGLSIFATAMHVGRYVSTIQPCAARFTLEDLRSFRRGSESHRCTTELIQRFVETHSPHHLASKDTCHHKRVHLYPSKLSTTRCMRYGHTHGNQPLRTV